MPKLFELERDRLDEAKKARTIVEKAITETRALTTEEDTAVKAHQAKITEMSRQIELFKLADTFEAATPEERSHTLGPDLPDLDGKHKYSLLRAIHLSLPENRTSKWDGLEAEVHQTLLKNRNERSNVNGILVPMNLSTHRDRTGRVERRDGVTTSTAAGGIANILGTELIEILRNKMVMETMGARVLSGLTGGTFSLPKQTAAATAYWEAEAVAGAVSNLTLGQVTWTPRTLTALTAFTRKALLQTSLDLEAAAREDLMAVLAREFDRVGVNGTGQNMQPLGLLPDPNVPTVAVGSTGGAMTWAIALNLEAQVAIANAEFGALGYLTSNQGRQQMKQIPKIAASTFPIFLWEKDVQGVGEVNGYRALASQQVPANITKSSGHDLTALLYGNFQSATYGLWSGMDVLADPYTRGAAGGLLIYMYQDCDFQLRYEQSFAKCVDMNTASS
jgi:HK97 family phage major capsid protein